MGDAMNIEITAQIEMYENEFKAANWLKLSRECDALSGLLPRCKGYKWQPISCDISRDAGSALFECGYPDPIVYDRKVKITATFKKVRK